ncbi:MAG: hypothetical protein QM756_01035 [Polyangiaceae bacterium]
MHSLWRTRTAGGAPKLLLAASVLLLVPLGCRKKTPAVQPSGPAAGSASAAPSSLASADAPAPPALACRELANGPAFTLGTPPARNPRPDDDEDEDDRNVEQPFAVELGSARAEHGQFAVAGLESQRGQNHAFVALLSADAQSHSRVELGRVFGDVEPPALVPHGNGWLALVADSDAGGVVLRLFAVESPFDDKSVRRGGEVSGVRRDACDFSFESSGGEGLVAFTKLEKGHGSIALARFDLEKLTLKGGAVAAPNAGSGEAESPRLVKRPNGYFLAWIVRGAAGPPKAALGRPSDYDAGLLDQGLVDEGPTAIEIVPLSATGAATATPQRVTPAGAHVLAFDITATPDGGALLVYRDDREGPGLERAGAEAVLVRPDGSTASRSWDLGETAGLPSLLADAAGPPKKPWAWLHAPSELDSRVAPLAESALEFAELRSAPELAGAELLAASSGRFLGVRTRGGQRALSVIECNAAP